MAKGDIQEQIDQFVEKLEKSKVPEKASGEVIVTNKEKKVKPPKKGEDSIPTFKDIDVVGFMWKVGGKTISLSDLVIPPTVYASEMSPLVELLPCLPPFPEARTPQIKI